MTSRLNIVIPESKKVTGKICNIMNLTLTNADLDEDIHLGFTIGENGRAMYWNMVWHQSGHVTVSDPIRGVSRWLDGDTIITVHFK